MIALRTILLLCQHGLRPFARSSSRATMRRARAQSAVLAGIACIVAAHLGLNIAMDTVLPQLRDPEYGWRAHKLSKALQHSSAETLVVALGSSRTQMGFSPVDMPVGDHRTLVYNLGQAGAGPLQQFLNLERLLHDGIVPDAVLVEVLPAALHGNSPGEDLLRPHVQRLGLSDLQSMTPYCHDPSSLRRAWMEQRLLPWHSQRFYLMSHVVPGFLPWKLRVDFQWRMLDEHGWLPYPFEPIDEGMRARGTAEAKDCYAQVLADWHPAPVQDRALHDLITLCQERGIAVSLYLMPESPVFRSMYAAASSQRIHEYLAGLQTAHPGLVIHDASPWLNDEQAFADGHHLMKSGARAFSQRYGQEFLIPWLAEIRMKHHAGSEILR